MVVNPARGISKVLKMLNGTPFSYRNIKPNLYDFFFVTVHQMGPKGI